MVLDHATSWTNLDVEKPLRLAVNSSAEEINDPTYADFILNEVDRTGFDPKNLVIEISENMAISDAGDVEEKLRRLRLAGVAFAIDDFGVGYSNLGRLKQLNFQILKIDQTLLHDVGSDRDANIIVSTVLNMCQQLGLGVIAEGIENDEQLEFLVREGYVAAQGYSLARPMDATSFVKFAKERHALDLGRNAESLAG